MNHFEEDPLENLLDAESDGEFGLTEVKNQEIQDLRSWTAKDFSSIYVRFYPHLLRHAKRYLSNHAQAEEVVQDAFLYLMTSLPEVDGEVGVLKLLKWKVRLLALDVIRINGRAQFSSVDDTKLVADEPEIDQNLIRADEAAIISMALAKLSPRQREAIISSVYEEKETAVVASQLGLSENATRQLLFRARSAFKKALVGEAEIAGLSASQILSVAARKAAQESAKYVAAASAFLVLVAVSIGVLPNLGSQVVTTVASSAPIQQPSIPAPSEEPESIQPQATIEQAVPEAAIDQSTEETTSELVLEAEEGPQISFEPAVAEPVVLEAAAQPGAQPSIIRTASLAPYLDLSIQQAEIVREGTSFFPNASNVLKIHSGVGLWAYVDYDSDDMTINGVAFEVMVDGVRFYASPRSFGSATSESDFGYTLTYSATEIFLIDDQRNVLSDHELAAAFATIAVQLDKVGDPVAANLFMKSN